MKNIVSIFSNYTRVKIITCLLEKDKNVSELIKNCGLSQSAVSQHLKKLKEAKVVSYYTQGKEKIYTLNSKEAGDISKKIIRFLSNKKYGN
jgi:DNA-binding transcriptional ArsR family regulator